LLISKTKSTLKKRSLLLLRSLLKVKIPDMAVNRLKRRSWSRRSRTSQVLRWSKAVSKLRDKSNLEEDSKTMPKVAVEAEVAVEVAEVADVEATVPATLPMETESKKEKDAQELRENRVVDPVVDVEEVVAEAKKVVKVVKTALLVEDAEKELKDLLTLEKKARENHLQERPEKVLILTIADQELDVEREINKSLEVAVANGEMPNKTSPKVKVMPKRLKVKPK
jgi:asparagine synthetase B (glutamine-hydrolysing)